jgi:hypothetical protein
MKRVALLMALLMGCSRTPLALHAPDGGVAGVGGILATGGATGSGGSTATPDGTVSTIDLDDCASDADCLTSCIWVTAPTGSGQCTANYCCGMTWLSQKRCELNRAAWATYCPNHAPTSRPCPCVVLCSNEAFRCMGGRCTTWCPPISDAAPDVAVVADGGSGPYCGDGIVNGTEECDNGILDGAYGGCTPQCTLGPHCGDGIVNGPECCDDGDSNGLDGLCSASCRNTISCGTFPFE